MSKGLLYIDDVCERFKCTRASVRGRLARGTFPVLPTNYRDGAATRGAKLIWTEQSIADWIDGTNKKKGGRHGK